MLRISLDVTKTLYDSDGYRHTLVRATPAQILTLVEGFYWLWDRRSGCCLVEGMAGNRLSNTRPPGNDLQSVRDPVAETRAFFLAQKAVRSAAASATAVLAHADETDRPHRTGAEPVCALPELRAPSARAGTTVLRPRQPAGASSSLVTAALMVGFFALGLLAPADRSDA